MEKTTGFLHLFDEITVWANCLFNCESTVCTSVRQETLIGHYMVYLSEKAEEDLVIGKDRM